MSCTRSILGGLLGAGIYGGASAGLDAAAGAIGSAIFKSAGYPDYSPTEAAQMGAVGAGIISGTIGAVGGALIGCADNVNLNVKVKGAAGCVLATGCLFSIRTISAVVAGLAGYSVMNHIAATETMMNLGETSLSFLAGGAISTCIAGPIILCAVLPMAACLLAADDKTPHKTADAENPPEQTTSLSMRRL